MSGFQDDEDEDIGFSSDDEDVLDQIMESGLKPGAFQSHHAEAEWQPAKSNLKRGGIQGHLASSRRAAEISDEVLEEEILKELQEIQDDPSSAARKQLNHMFISEKRILNSIYKRLENTQLTPKQTSELLRAAKDSSDNLLRITEALKLQPKLSKDDAGGDNVATLSELLERFRTEVNAYKESGDPFNLADIAQEQREKILAEESGDKDTK